MSLQQQIEQKIRDSFEAVYLQLENESHMHSGPATESHFKMVLVTPEFNELNRVKRHQAVYKALSEEMPQFHALALHTFSPEEWEASPGVVAESPKCGGGNKKQS